jgi:hypothetical protein
MSAIVCTTPAEVLALSRKRARSGYAGWGEYSRSQGVTERLVREGDASLVAASEAYLADFAKRLPPTIRKAPMLDVYGDRPHVPRAIAAMRGGDPRAMLRRVSQSAERSLSRIFVDVGCSASVSEATMAKRGAAALGLVRALASSRPIALAAVMCGRSCGLERSPIVVHLPSAPLDVARAAAWIGSAATFRRTFASLDGTGYMPLQESEMDKGREALRCGPYDIYVPPVYVGGLQDRDPVTWLIEASRHLIEKED